MLPANFIEGRQSVKEITCDLIQVARAGASRMGRDGRCGSNGSGGSGGRYGIAPVPPKGDNLEKRLVGAVGIMGEVGVMGEV